MCRQGISGGILLLRQKQKTGRAGNEQALYIAMMVRWVESVWLPSIQQSVQIVNRSFLWSLAAMCASSLLHDLDALTGCVVCACLGD